jgi:hypothetical protein
MEEEVIDHMEVTGPWEKPRISAYETDQNLAAAIDDLVAEFEDRPEYSWDPFFPDLIDRLKRSAVYVRFRAKTKLSRRSRAAAG